MKVLQILKKHVPLICLLLFVSATLPELIQHTSGFDEAHAWMNARFMNFTNWSEILRSEGHPILWYLLIMPFAKTDFAYPYPMYILNYAFCLAALIFMWLKAPFNTYIKAIITFSSIFVSFYGIVARNYSIGILGLFLLAHCFRTNFKKPILCAIVIALTFHTHILCAIGAGIFFLFLVYNIFTEKHELSNYKKIAICTIPILSGLFYIYPYLHGFSSEQNLWYAPPTTYYLSCFFFLTNYGITFISYILLSTILLYTVKKEACPLIFYFSTTALMLVVFGCFYSGTPHHYFMFFIYLIITMWISKDTEKLFNNFVFIILLILLFIPPIQQTIEYIYPKDDWAYVIKNINQIEELRNKSLYVPNTCRYFIPYLNKDIEVYDFCTYEKLNWKIYSKVCKTTINEFYWDKVKTFENDTYLLYLKNRIRDEINNYDFEKIFNLGDLYIYKMNKNSGFKKIKKAGT